MRTIIMTDRFHAFILTFSSNRPVMIYYCNCYDYSVYYNTTISLANELWVLKLEIFSINDSNPYVRDAGSERHVRQFPAVSHIRVLLIKLFTYVIYICVTIIASTSKINTELHRIMKVIKVNLRTQKLFCLK